MPDLSLFEITIKPGGESNFRLGKLVLAASSFSDRDGARIYFCATLQPAAFKAYLTTSAEVQSFRELEAANP